MSANTPDSNNEDPESTTRRRFLGLALVGITSIGTGASMVAAARHDDHDDEDEPDHDDHGGNDHDDDDGGPATQLADGSWEVRITDDDADAFLPGLITIQAGESITWVNNDDKPHTATGADWDTGTLDPGQRATVVFDGIGTFTYACLIHPVMTGTVVVEGSGAGATPGASPAAMPDTAGNNVRIYNLVYEPATLEVAVGSTVVWTNDDNLPHTVTSSDGVFDTNTIKAKTTAELTFDTPGTFDYVCAFHPGMAGTIVVS